MTWKSSYTHNKYDPAHTHTRHHLVQRSTHQYILEMHRHTHPARCFLQIFQTVSKLNHSWNFTTDTGSVQLEPNNDSQKPMTTGFPHTCKSTWHCAPTSTVLGCRSPTEPAGEDGSQNNGPVLIHIRWLSVTWRSAKGQRPSQLHCPLQRHIRPC